MAKLISISDQEFSFDRLHWPSERVAYINAWKNAFGRDGYEDRIDWLIGSPLNRTYTLKNQANSIVAAYSLIKNQMVWSGSIIESAICNNVFCVPECQGMNLFVRIGRLSLNDAASDYEFAYGFPNSLAIAGHKRVGWKIINNAYNISVKLSAKSVTRAANPVSPINVEQISEKDRRVISIKAADAALTKSLSDNKLVSTAKTQEYIYWRFFDRPRTVDRSYYVLPVFEAYMLFSIFHPRNEINILDFHPLNEESEQNALESLHCFACLHNIQSIKLFGCSEHKLALKLIDTIRACEQDIHYEEVDMIVNKLGKESADFEYYSLPCSMSFLDNDVY